MTDVRAETSPELDDAHAALMAAAKSRDLAASDAPDLVGVTFRGGGASDATRIQPGDLPARARALTIGRYSVILGLLPEEPAQPAVKEIIRRYRNQCVVARSYLSPNQALDLHLFLLGPRGSDRVDEWRAMALFLERDDRVARKLAWLRPKDTSGDGKSFDIFLKRTFLAQPWARQALYSMAALDSLNRAAALADNKVPQHTADDWMKLAEGDHEDADAFVANIVDAWKARGRQ